MITDKIGESLAPLSEVPHTPSSDELMAMVEHLSDAEIAAINEGAASIILEAASDSERDEAAQQALIQFYSDQAVARVTAEVVGAKTLTSRRAEAA